MCIKIRLFEQYIEAQEEANELLGKQKADEIVKDDFWEKEESLHMKLKSLLFKVKQRLLLIIRIKHLFSIRNLKFFFLLTFFINCFFRFKYLINFMIHLFSGYKKEIINYSRKIT